MQIVILILFIFLSTQSYAQNEKIPTREEMQAELRQSMADTKEQKNDLIKQIGIAKKNNDDPESIRQMLETPAKIRVFCESGIIFETDPLKAWMVVIDNRDYILKDLPKHVPQFFVVWWEWNEWAPQAKIGEIMEMDFPFEKLQAMIR